MALQIPIVRENLLLAQFSQMKLVLGVGGLSTLPTQYTGNTTFFALPYAEVQPPFTQQHSLSPAQVG